MQKFKAFREYELSDINKVAGWYTEGLKGTGLILPEIADGYYSSWAQYTVQIPEGAERKKVQDGLKTADIPAMVYYAKPMHKQGAFENTDSAMADCPVTERLCSAVLSLPIDPYKSKEDVDLVVETIKKVM